MTGLAFRGRALILQSSRADALDRSRGGREDAQFRVFWTRYAPRVLFVIALYYAAAHIGFAFQFAGPVAWKCVGMLVACYAPGYWWAARRPLPEIVAIGLLGKILGPIGFYRRSVFVVDADGIVRYAHRAMSGLTYRPAGELLEAVEAAKTPA